MNKNKNKNNKINYLDSMIEYAESKMKKNNAASKFSNLESFTSSSVSNVKEYTPVRPILNIKDKKVKLILSKNLLNQIAFSHSYVGDIEWSGMLLFKEQSGSLQEGDLELFCDYIHMLDVGTSAYTEFSVDENIVDLYEEFPEAINYKVGIIHTHHSMNCFFSGTDTQELQDNTDKYPYYLSLIVNHKGQYCAKVAYIAKTEGNIIKSLFGSYKRPDEEYLCTIDCMIEFEIDQHFKDRVVSLSDKRSKYSNSLMSRGIDDFNPITGYKKPETLADHYDNQLSMFGRNTTFNKDKKESRVKNKHRLSKYYDSEKLESFISKWITMDSMFTGTLRDAVLEIFKEIGQNNPDGKLGYWLDLTLDSLSEMIFNELSLIPTQKEKTILYADIIDILEQYNYYDFIEVLVDELKKPQNLLID
jgi:hypothetical protein